jgi:hypothetical protein
LDKTPRYYYILKEIEKILPNSKLILLVRNPISVLLSIINRWVGEKWWVLNNFEDDLFEAPKNIAYANKNLNNTKLVKYEDLILSTEDTISSVVEFCSLPREKGLGNYGDRNTDRWSLGDMGTVYDKKKPSAEHLSKWKSVDNPQTWRILRDYAKMLDPKVMNSIGYDIHNIRSSLDDIKPGGLSAKFTLSLEFVLRKVEIDKRYRQHCLSTINAFHRKGSLGVCRYLARKVYSLLKKL